MVLFIFILTFKVNNKFQLEMKLRGGRWENKEGKFRPFPLTILSAGMREEDQIWRSLTKKAFSLMNLKRGSESLPMS